MSVPSRGLILVDGVSTVHPAARLRDDEGSRKDTREPVNNAAPAR